MAYLAPPLALWKSCPPLIWTLATPLHLFIFHTYLIMILYVFGFKRPDFGRISNCYKIETNFSRKTFDHLDERYWRILSYKTKIKVMSILDLSIYCLKVVQNMHLEFHTIFCFLRSLWKLAKQLWISLIVFSFNLFQNILCLKCAEFYLE